MQNYCSAVARNEIEAKKNSNWNQVKRSKEVKKQNDGRRQNDMILWTEKNVNYTHVMLSGEVILILDKAEMMTPTVHRVLKLNR